MLICIVSPQKLAFLIYMLYVSNKYDILRVGTCNIKLLIKKGKKSLAYLDPQMAMRTSIQLRRQDIVAYFVEAMRCYKDKEMLVVPFNMGNHWLTLSISTTYDQVWYCDPSRPTHSRTSNRLTHNWSDVISVLDK
jgi:hypothetical protein